MKFGLWQYFSEQHLWIFDMVSVKNKHLFVSDVMISMIMNHCPYSDIFNISIMTSTRYLCFRWDDIYDNETLSLPWYFQYFYHDKPQISLFQMWWYPTSPCMKMMVMTMVIYTMMTVCTMTSGTGGDPSHLFLALDFSPAEWPRSWNTWLRYNYFLE